MRVADGIELRHGVRCPAARTENPGKCSKVGCSYRARAHGQWSPRFPMRAQAEEWRRAQLAEGKAKRNGTPAITLQEAWTAWLTKAQAGTILNRSGRRYKPGPLRDYDASVRKRLLPDYGANAAAEVSQTALKRLISDMLAEGLSPSTVRNTINPLRALYRDADLVTDGGLPNDPTNGLRLPAVRSRRDDDRIPTPEQARRLVEHAPDRDRALWALACYAGLRRGELRALRWKHLDLKAGLVRVRRSWDRKEGEISPKSDAGPRDVPIFAELRPILEARHGDSADTSAEAFVFATRTGGTFDPSEVSKRADKAWAKARPPVERFTLHEGRHGAASVWIEAGVNAKRVQRWMGHSSITTTFDIYGHLIDRSEPDEVAEVDDFLVGHSVGHRGAEQSGNERKALHAPPAPPLPAAAS